MFAEESLEKSILSKIYWQHPKNEELNALHLDELKMLLKLRDNGLIVHIQERFHITTQGYKRLLDLVLLSLEENKT